MNKLKACKYQKMMRFWKKKTTQKDKYFVEINNIVRTLTENRNVTNIARNTLL